MRRGELGGGGLVRLVVGGVVVGLLLHAGVIGAALVWWSPGHESLRWFMASPTDSRVLYRVSFWGGERIGVSPESVEPADVLHRIDPRAQPGWRTLPARGDEPRVRFVDAAGFPFRSVYCVWVYDRAHLEDPLFYLDTIGSEHLRGGVSLGDIDRGELRVVDNWLVLPLRPVWGGLAGNFVVYSVVGVGLVWLRGVVVAGVGRRKGASGVAGREGERGER